MRSLLCLATAWATSWPTTTANSSSEEHSYSKPSYTTIFPPGIQNAFTWSSFTRLNSHAKFCTSWARPFVLRYSSVAAAIFFPTRVTIALPLVSDDVGADFMYSEYCDKLEVSTSESDTNNNWFQPVMGTLPQLLSRREAPMNNPISFFIVFLIINISRSFASFRMTRYG